MTDDLIAWLRAQLDDDVRLIDEYEAYMAARSAAAGSYVLVTPPGWHPGEPFDPDRQRGDVDAKRRILDDIIPLIDGMDAQIEAEFGTGGSHPAESEQLLRLLALPYADRPGCPEVRTS